MSPNSQRWAAGAAATLVAVANMGCGRQKEPAVLQSTEPPPPSHLAETSPGTVPDDPAQDGWDTELASERIGTQLALMKQWLTEEKPAAAGVEKFAAGDCTGSGLAGAEPDPQFAGGVFKVSRSVTGGRGAAFDGLEGLAAAMGKLRGGTEAHAAIKVTRIHSSADGWETVLRFQLDEHTAAGRRQVNAVWPALWSRDEAPLLKRIDLSAWEEVTAARAQAFADCTEALFAGNTSWREHLAFGTDHWTARIESILGMDVNGQNGVTLGDINGDGLDDFHLPQQGGLPNRMFLRQLDGTLKDVTEESGTGWLDDAHAALLIDLDNDGDQDLVTGMRDGILIQANDGLGKFTVKATKLMPTGVPYGLAAADYDQDGDLDVFAACYHQRTTAARNETFARPVPYHDAENGAQDVLLRNDGNWQFTDAAKSSGIVENKFSYAPSWEDYDDDGDMDLFVANDFGSKRLWRNDRTPEDTVIFTEVAVTAGVQDVGAGMSSAWGDPDNDGRMDLYVGNMFSSAGNRIAFQEKFQRSAQPLERRLYQRHARGNSLFHNKGDGTFDDVSEAAGVTSGRWAWSSRFADLNNDGREDIYVANGYITQEDPHDL